MSLEVLISARAEQDAALQYRWYLDNADLDVAEGYLRAMDETIQGIALHPDLGMRRRFKAMELAGIRSIPLKKPFQQHLIFYGQSDVIRIERIMHGARDLPRRLLEDPGSEGFEGGTI